MRWVRVIVVCLVLGTVVNVLMAWGFAAWGTTPNTARVGSVEYLRQTQWRVFRVLRERSGVGKTTRLGTLDDPVDSFTLSIEQLTGWPKLSMRSHAIVAIQKSSKKMSSVSPFLDRGVLLGDDLLRSRRLPLVPVFPGFAVNTLLYAGVIAMPVIGVGVWRRRRRTREGCCVACGYGLAGLEKCPECGAEA